MYLVLVHGFYGTYFFICTLAHRYLYWNGTLCETSSFRGQNKNQFMCVKQGSGKKINEKFKFCNNIAIRKIQKNIDN